MKLSFFKLPFFFILFYSLFNFILSGNVQDLFDIFIHYGSDSKTETFFSIECVKSIFYFLLYNFYQLPNLLLIFIVSAISLHKFSIHQINRNNMLYSLLIVLLIVLIINFFKVYFADHIDVDWVIDIRFYLYLYPLAESLWSILVNLYSYIGISLLIYFGIKLFNPFYTHTANFLNVKNSKNIHYLLYC